VEQLSKEREMQIELLNKEKELQDAVIKNQKLVRNVFMVIFLAVLAFAGSIFFSLNQKKKANQLLSKQNKEIAAQKDLIDMVNKDLELAFNQIEKQNRDITSSITYAQRIQQAMLPMEENLKSIIPESFIILKPRDIVSGDFYWFSGYASPKSIRERSRSNYIRLHNIGEDESGFLITAVDCTGHGVPGAFMSMIGFNLLETIVRNGITSPNLILNELHRSVRYLLKQYNTDNQDGMDMSFCHIKNNGKTVQFAGAKNPIYFVSNGELVHLKADSVPIGGMQKESRREFTLHNIEISEPTTFYMFSDGYIDQFGGINGQKFGSPRFKELLLGIHKLPLAEQKKIIETKINEWIGPNRKQIDDILVMGFKLDGQDISI
jgi:serine phosphatase RsbU (regulator of sigma subunit)